MRPIALTDESNDRVDALLAEFVDAAREGAELGGWLRRLEPTFRRWTMISCARNQRLLDQVGMQADEVFSLVLERLFLKPPTNPKDREPRKAVRAWITTVTTNILLDKRRRLDAAERERLRPIKPPTPSERKARAIAALVDADAAEWCAEHRLSQRKYLREVFYALRDDVRITGIELARAAGLVDEATLEALPEEERMEKERKLIQHAWKLRERTCRALREALEERARSRSSEAAS